MTASLRIDVLGTVKQGVFTPASPRVATRLCNGGMVIGSRPGSEPCLVLDDGTVSRDHAEVSACADSWRIRDLASDNGLVLLEDQLDFAKPIAVATLTGKRVEEVAIVSPVTLALGAVVLRLTAERPPAGPAREA